MVAPGVVIAVGTQLTPACRGGGSTVIAVLVLTPAAATYSVELLEVVTAFLTLAVKVALVDPGDNGTNVGTRIVGSTLMTVAIKPPLPGAG